MAEITRQAVEERAKALRAKQQECLDRQQQALSDANAYSGAAQDCDYWLEILGQKSDNPTETSPPAETL